MRAGLGLLSRPHWAFYSRWQPLLSSECLKVFLDDARWAGDSLLLLLLSWAFSLTAFALVRNGPSLRRSHFQGSRRSIIPPALRARQARVREGGNIDKESACPCDDTGSACPREWPGDRDSCERAPARACGKDTDLTDKRGRSAAEQPSRTTETPARSGVMASDALLKATCVPAGMH